MLALALALANHAAAGPPVALAVDWPAFLARHDPHWRWQAGGSSSQQAPPHTWDKSLYGGNAMLGFMLWQPDNHTVRIDVGRADLYDDRTLAATPHAFTGDFVYDRPRLPIGHLVVSFGAPIVGASGRIGLWDAEAQYNITAAGRTTALRMWASADHELADALVLELGGAAERAEVRWVPEKGDSFWMARTVAKTPVLCSSRDMPKCNCTGTNRVGYGLCNSCPVCGISKDCLLCDNYTPNPPARTVSKPGAHGALNVTTQPHLRGTAHSTAVLDFAESSAFIVATSPVSKDAAAADAWASAQVLAAAKAGVENLRAAHRAWWHAFWPAGGFVTCKCSRSLCVFFRSLKEAAVQTSTPCSSLSTSSCSTSTPRPRGVAALSWTSTAR